MEISRFEDVKGGVTTDAIVEGRFVVLTSHSQSIDFGSQADLPGLKLPASEAEAVQAKYILAFAQESRSLPIYEPTPSFDFALREGWDKAANAPFSATVYTTYPGNMEGRTVPSGVGALAYGEGTYILASGEYVYSANLVKPGAAFEVLNTGDDGASAGKISYVASNSAQAVGIVERYDATDGRLTIVLR